jgi:hypothetical protein
MEKCPYCAEDIQDEAKKCKHCGEWLTASQDGKLIIDEIDAVQKEIKKDEVNADLNATANEAQKTLEAGNRAVRGDEDSSKYRKIPGAKSLIKKPGKYGWGWLIFFGILANYDIRNDPFSNAAVSNLWSTSIFVFLYYIFGSVENLLKNGRTPCGNQPWLQDFVFIWWLVSFWVPWLMLM